MRFNYLIFPFLLLPPLVLFIHSDIIDPSDKQKPALKLYKYISEKPGREISPPLVKIEQPYDNSIIHWGAQVRYAINVSDIQNGDSRYGEINPYEVLLEIQYLPGENVNSLNIESGSRNQSEHKGLSLLQKSSCFTCHADRTSLVGPSFSEIADRYDTNTETLELLGKRIIEGSTGVWGNIDMPPQEYISRSEARQIADYILEQGSRSDRWVYPGLDGVFQVIEKPEQDAKGHYILTASYINNHRSGDTESGMRGEHSILLNIE